MSLSPRTFFVSAAILAAAGATALSALAGQGDDAKPARKPDVKVEAPYTRVEAGRRVQVDAPYTNVDVDPDRRRVRVQAPFVDVNVRW
jgi:hypothetical protein